MYDKQFITSVVPHGDDIFHSQNADLCNKYYIYNTCMYIYIYMYVYIYIHVYIYIFSKKKKPMNARVGLQMLTDIGG